MIRFPLSEKAQKRGRFATGRFSLTACFVLLMFAGLGRATITGALSQGLDLLQLSLEDLGNVNVTSVSKKSQPLSETAAAIHVITQEDIRRSGVNMIAETLRMAPGLQVARANSRQWGVSSRGFNETFANKLLVLMDGRSLYTPLFSGVYWGETDTVLEDIDRIEVIRGPGATLWGANAVNGVINIITKDAKETQGVLLSGGGGIEQRGFGTVRYGGRLGTNAYYRVYGKYANQDDSTLLDGSSGGDHWWMSRTGFRADWEPSEANHVTLQGDAYYGDFGGRFLIQTLDPPAIQPQVRRAKVEGSNILGRWKHEFSSVSDMALQIYYVSSDRGLGIGNENRDTFDFDGQHRFELGDRHEIVWGMGYRYSVDDITESFDFRMTDSSETMQLFSIFGQDEIELMPDRLHLTLGTKLEHHEYTGFEVQPNVRLAWTLSEKQTFWGAVSRAVRTPSRAERDFQVFGDLGPYVPPTPFPVVAPGSGNRDLLSEELIAYEIGYRLELRPNLSMDFSTFYNDYDNLRSVSILPLQLGPASSTPYFEVPLTFRNELVGETFGGEVSATWQPLDAWRLRANYTFIKTHLRSVGGQPSLTVDTGGNSPEHQVSIRSQINLSSDVDLDLGVRWVDRLDGVLQQIPSYTELESRIAWRPNQNCEVAVVGNNLLHAHHREFNPVVIFGRDAQVDRSVFAKVTLRF